MTAFAVAKVIAAEGFLIIMTGGAARRAARRKVHRRERRRDLSPASRACLYRMTARAVHRLQMPVMRERGRVSLCPYGSFLRASRLVTGSARRHHVSRIRRVTLKTAVVRVRARRNREPDAAARLFMTARAVRLALVFRMVEPRVKALQPGKTLDARRCVTNRANRVFIAFVKLLFMTARARNMSHISDRRRIVRPRVTNQTRQATVRRVRVFEA